MSSRRGIMTSREPANYGGGIYIPYETHSPGSASHASSEFVERKTRRMGGKESGRLRSVASPSGEPVADIRSPSKEPPSLLILSHSSAEPDQGKASSVASVHHSGSEDLLGTSHEPTKESCHSEPCPPSRPDSTVSSPGHPDAPLETKREEDSGSFMEAVQQKPFRRRKGYPDTEWTFYPSSGHLTYHTGKKCVFDGIYLRNKTSTSERTLEMCMGKKKYEIDSRNGILLVTPGDHPYVCPEQSKDFYKMASTMPPVNFGSATRKKKSDTFIPLEHLPGVPSVPFRVKEKQQELEREKLEVKNLDRWKPAPMLQQTLTVTVPGRRMTYQPS
ncbi:spermatogenesis-associated serine-rich protein 1 [Sphaerodactylus townsendi]|uniref:spermatogenesis-associated serine-rich protein 1 n=1 Tax=Sphaerodactylus townsendi TaxID=933632 RepID=UPI0020269CF8|nr:spermatogenesis-associated serine-rich protein 1 [Sphaerodactylus townsendi]